MKDFIELKSTENQTLFIRKDAIGAFEVVPPSARVEGHIKIFIGGFKFLVQGTKEELIQKISQ
jgi:hypothetical protein